MRRVTPLLAALAMLVAACGADVSDSTTTTAPSTTSTTVDTTTTTLPDTTTTLAGEPIEFGPRDDDIVMVAGVEYDDVLNLRAGPGAD